MIMTSRHHKYIDMKHRWLLIVMWIAVAASLLLFIAGSFRGTIFLQDEGYQALNCLYYSDSPIAMLSFYMGHLAVSLFGNELIVLRLLTRLCYIVAIGLPLIYYYRRTGNAFMTLGTAAFLMVYLSYSFYFKFYGWDVGAYPFMSALLVCLMTYIDHPTRVKALIAGALCAALTLARIPAIVAIPVMLLTICLAWPRGERRRSLPDILWAVAAFAVASVALILLMKGSISAYIDSWKPENIITGHDTGIDNLRRLMRWTCDDLEQFKRVPFFYFTILSITALALVYRRMWGRTGWWFAIGLSVSFLIVMIFQWHGAVAIGLYLLPLVLFAMIWVISHYAHGLGKRDALRVLLVIAFSLIAVVGSDRILQRFGFFYCIPLLMSIVYRYRQPIFSRVVALIMLFTIFPRGVYECYNFVAGYRDGQMIHEELPHHKLIYNSPEEWQSLSGEAPVVDQLRRDGIRYAFFGNGHYVYEYIYNSENPAHLQWFHYYDPEEIARWVKAYTSELDAVFLRNEDLQFLSFESTDSLFRANGFVPVKVLRENTLYEPKSMVDSAEIAKFEQICEP